MSSFKGYLYEWNIKDAIILYILKLKYLWSTLDCLEKDK